MVYDGELPLAVTQKEAIEAALQLAKRIKKKALLEIELKAIGTELYVKLVDLELVNGDNGYYAIFHKGVQQFPVKPASSQDVQAVLEHLKTLKLKPALIDCGYVDPDWQSEL
ncbi:hypothetical protein [Microcoleus sp. Pol14C6]|uniref:hypothetical protein n=1 Tax=Microcoleus sp. Pol14C6 TaxID=3055399 RepID=UPI002FCF80E2